jgi:hypothetical protein
VRLISTPFGILKRILIAVVVFPVVAKITAAQQTSAEVLYGTWDICTSLDTLDITYTKPFGFYQLKPGGEFQQQDYLCGNKKLPIKTTWRFENGIIYISAYKGPCLEMQSRTISSIQFLSNDLFYTKYFSAVENTGKPIYTIYKRRK